MERLAIFLPPIDPQPAGVGVYCTEICSRIVHLRPDTVLFSEREQTLPEPLRDAEHLFPRGAVSRLAATIHPRLARRLALDHWLPRQFDRLQIDALLVPFHDGMRRPRRPQIVVMHDLTIERVPSAYPRSVRLYHRHLVRSIVRRSDRVIAVSENTRRDLETCWSVARQRIHHVQEGFDRTVFKPADRDEITAVRGHHRLETPYLLYSGTLSLHKNLEVVLAALGKLSERFPDLLLAISGRTDGERAESLRNKAATHGVADRLRWLGYVPRTELSTLMSGCSAFVFPSLYEGFGLAALEAMASGAHVLAADRGSLPELLADAGELLPAEDPNAWAVAISSWIAETDDSRQSDSRQRAVRRAAHFDWDTAAVDLLGVVSEAVEAQPMQPMPSAQSVARKPQP